MTLTYNLSDDDYLQHLVFKASISDRIKKQRRKSWVLNAVMVLCAGVLSFLLGYKFLTYYFLIAEVLIVFLFPVYSRWYYKNHYKKVIKETHKNGIDKTCTINISEIEIESSDSSGMSKIYMSEMDKFYETAQHFFLIIKSGATLIIPKNKIDHIDELRKQLITISNKLKIEFIPDLNWSWK